MALKPGQTSIKPWKGHNIYRYRVSYHADGKLQRRGFEKKKDAEEFAAQWEEEVRRGGNCNVVTDEERSAILELRPSLAESGISLREAIGIALERQAEVAKSITISELIERHLSRKRREGKSEQHLSGLSSHLRRFAESFGERLAATIETEEISDWLEELGVEPTTVMNYRASLLAIFNRAVESGWARSNPVEGAFKPKKATPEVGHLTPEEARRLLEASCERIRPVVAIGLFAGLRRKEIERLTWDQVVLRDGTDGDWGVIRARKTKTGIPRNVEILSVLASWLEPYRNCSGSVWPPGGRRLLDEAKNRAGFGTPGEVEVATERGETLKEWPDNALRHSYGTYHHALFENIGRTAKQMGNSAAMIEKHYDAAAEKRDAEAYFSLFPASSKN